MVLFFEISMWISVLPCLISIVASSSAAVDASTATPLISFFPSLPAAPSQFPTRLSKSLSKMKRLTASARSPNFSPRVPFFWRRLYLKKSVSGALLLVGLALALFSSLRCRCCCCSPGLLSLLLLLLHTVVVSGIAFFFCVDLFEKLNRKERSGKKEDTKISRESSFCVNRCITRSRKFTRDYLFKVCVYNYNPQ